MTIVVGTAGHIDHGKTSLLRALTGIDADRLPEERRRGMTIDVGYAHLRLPDGDELDFVDVPGHDRLIGNMLVGAGEIDAVLLVVAADDGPRPQTLEHLELLDALGLGVGAVAVTKADLVEAARIAEVIDRVGELLARTTLAGSPVVAVSSLSGVGLDELRVALIGLRDRARAGPAMADGPARLAIDRAFVIRGRGTVVTGSLRGGRIVRGQPLDLVPGGRTIRIRELQVHDAPVEAGEGGGRIALNITGDLDPPPHRGDVLTSDPAVRATADLLVLLHEPARLEAGSATVRSWPPAAGSAIRLHLGTAAVDGRIRRGRRDTVALPDGRQVVRLRLERPIAAAAADRFVLRRPSPLVTIAGGVVLDADPPVGVSNRRVTPERLTRLVDALGRAQEYQQARLALHGVLAAPDEPAGRQGAHDPHSDERRQMAGDVALALEAAAVVAVGSGGAGVSLAETRPALARTLRRLATVDPRAATALVDGVIGYLVHEGRLVQRGDRLGPSGTDPDGVVDPAILEAMARLERALAVLAPPALSAAARSAGCSAEAVRRLAAEGRIVRLEDDLAYATSTFDGLQAAALDLAAAGPLTPSAFRDATGTSRRYVLAILEELDRRGVLRRTADGHVPGPRATR